jgi:hypothetical protein
MEEVMAAQDWQALTRLTQGMAFIIERVRLVDQDVALEGQFAPPPLAMLTAEDQVFVAAFVRCHGSIKQMERFFGVSYPTIKNRLNRIGNLLSFVEVEPTRDPPPVSKDELLSQLERGEIGVDDVLARLAQRSEEKS